MRTKRSTTGRLVAASLAGLSLVVLAALLFWAGPAPEIVVEPRRPGIGPSTLIDVSVREPSRGLSKVRIVLEQDERQEVLHEETFRPRPAWKLWAEGISEESFTVEVGEATQPWLEPGKAAVRVEAARAPAVLRSPPPVVESLELPVDLTPPRLQVLSTQTYVRQGGSEAVVYRVEGAARHGVRAGEWFFAGHPLPARGEVREGEHFALFAAPWDLAEGAEIRLVAVDELGNRASASVVDRFTPSPPAHEDITLGDEFLRKVVSEIAARVPSVPEEEGDLEAYLFVNGELRQRNREGLVELAERSRPEFLWKEPFRQFPGGQVMSSFAVTRTYFHEDEVVDEQTHLGFDLASTRHAEVPAAAAGVVLHADYLGIYGNAVVLDHGYGLMSLYAHLSSMAVGEGERVERGEILGRTGETGLAGGDHLHFATLLGGLPVTPVEWWDGHWIRDRLGRKLGDALPFMRSATESDAPGG